MSSHQPTGRLFAFGASHPRQIAMVRLVIGAWLLVVTGFLFAYDQAGWAVLPLLGAVLHFVLAYRLLRIARRQDGRDL